MNISQTHPKARLLFINPWIYDFAAFDFWMKPLGFLYLAGYLRQHGYAIHLIDCLDRHNLNLLIRQRLSTPRMRAYGTGKFFRQSIPTPRALKDIPYTYRRYGIPEDLFMAMLHAAPHPAVILVTSMMTYWYPGVFRAIELAKQVFPEIPVLLGGVYATLCYQHAVEHSGADYVVRDSDPANITRLIDELIGFPARERQLPSWEGRGGDSDVSCNSAPFLPTPCPSQKGNLAVSPRKNLPLKSDRRGASATPSLFNAFPAFDLYERLDYACVLTSLGCPYRCTYCASHLLCPGFFQRKPEEVFNHIHMLYETKHIHNFAFYDDALLVNSSQHLEPLLEQIIETRLPLFLHTPNGLHARYMTERLARLMFDAGFKTLRLGLETINRHRQHSTGGKVTEAEFKQAVTRLKQAGFDGNQIGVYLFVGLPGQELCETEETIRFVHASGVLANLCEYSPIPGTQEWEILEQQGYISSEDDPVIHNNTVFLYMKERHTFDHIQALKDLVRELNKSIKGKE